MDIAEASFESTIVVGLTNPPIPMSAYSTDQIREKSLLKYLGALPDQLLLADNINPAIQGKIEPTRWEFSTNNAEYFLGGKFADTLDTLCKAVSGVKVVFSAIGTNYLLRFTVKDVPDAGAYIASRFLAGKPVIEEKLGKPILSSATRLVWGTPQNFFDLKLHPIELQKNQFGGYLHIHKEGSVSADGFVAVLRERFKTEPNDFEEILKKL